MKTSFFRSWIWVGLGVLLFYTITARAHYCGPPIIRCKPGDIITYYIISDRAEQGTSFFSVFDQTNPSVAPVVYYTPVGRVFGLYVIQALQVGTNQIAMFWSFPPNSASDFCVVEVRVTTNPPPITAGNSPFSAFDGDPVNTYTGELVQEFPSDLSLGGPMPLEFHRYYASRLQADGLVNSRVGNNWSHNFEWRAVVLTNQALIVSPNGFRARFNKSGTNWVLQSPTWLPFQLVNSGNNIIFGDPRDNRLYTFNTNGLLASINDGKGNTHTLSYTNVSYTNNDLLLSVSDGLGRTLTFDYVGAHQLRSVSDGTRLAGFTQIELGTEFNLIRVTNTLGKVTSYTYDNSKLIGSLLTGTTYPAGNAGYSQVYDNDARVIQQTRLGTNITRFVYDTTNYVTYVTNAAGGLNVYTHSADGHLLALGDPAGQSLTLATNALGLRARITDRTGASYGIGYDTPSGQPNAVTNADGSITSFTYTNRTVSGIVFQEIASVTLPDGSTQQFTYDASGNVIVCRDRAGKLTRIGYNSRGQVLAVTNALGGVVNLSYNADGTLASKSDLETGTLTFQHDALRRPTNSIASDTRSFSVVYDAGDRILSITDERTNTSYFVYDSNNRQTAVTNALGQVTQFNYDTADRLTRVTDRAGFALGRAYDKLDNVIAQTNRNNNAVVFGWDARQRLISQTDPAGKVWSFGYDNEGLPNRITTPLGHITGFARDTAGFLVAMTNALGQTTLLGRDLAHRLSSAIDPQGRLDQFTYESRGLLTNTTFSAIGVAVNDFNDLGLLSRITDQRGNQWLFNYSALGRLTSFVDPLNRTNTVSYDGRGRPQRFLYADGSTQTNSYDPAGNLAGINFSGGTNLSFSHDKLHRLTNAPNLVLAYDAEDRVTNTVSAGINFGAAYDAGGRITNASYNNGTLSVTYTYDSRDRLTQVRDSLTSAQVNFFYDDSGRLTNVTRANGVGGIYDHDAASRITRIREGSFLDLQYTYNAAGDIVSLSQTAPLIAPPSPQTNNFSYDAAQQINTAGFGYDNRGRLISSPGHTYVWNAASQLIRVDSVTNTFNGAGNLLTRAVSGGTMRYHYNHAIRNVPIMAEQNAGTSAFQRYYVWTPDGRLLYMIDATSGNAVSYFHFDLAGSTLALSSGAGTISDAYAYSPYGELLARTGSNPQPFTYVGRYGVRAETNASLYQMRARFYEPVTARFLSRDPLWPRPSDPFSLNPYAYAANNPLRFIDPSGTKVDAEVSMPVNAISADQIAQTGAANVGDLLKVAPASPSSPYSSINLSDLGKPRAMVFIDGIRARNSGGSSSDTETIPTSQIERVEVLKDGATSVYGSDAVAGVINIITKKETAEPSYGGEMLNLSYKYEGTLSLGLNYDYAPSPPPPSEPQPVRAGGQVSLHSLSSEFMCVGAYSALVQSVRNGRSIGPEGAQLASMFVYSGWFGPGLRPRGAAFVNGQVVHSKPADFIYGAFLKEEFYDYLDYEGVTPRMVYQHMLYSTLVGGSGGNFADMMGYRAQAMTLFQ